MNIWLSLIKNYTTATPIYYSPHFTNSPILPFTFTISISSTVITAVTNNTVTIIAVFTAAASKTTTIALATLTVIIS